MQIRLASDLTYDSIVDGPGLRTVIWTQGCIHNCKGCHNPETHNLNGGFVTDTDVIINQMHNSKLQKGITISGGEPFLQPIPLTIIAKAAKELNLDVWVYTGFIFEDIIKYKDCHNLLKYVDVLVDGKFVEKLKDINLQFRGSSNQRVINVKESFNHKEITLWHREELVIV